MNLSSIYFSLFGLVLVFGSLGPLYAASTLEKPCEVFPYGHSNVKLPVVDHTRFFSDDGAIGFAREGDLWHPFEIATGKKGPPFRMPGAVSLRSDGSSAVGFQYDAGSPISVVPDIRSSTGLVIPLPITGYPVIDYSPNFISVIANGKFALIDKTIGRVVTSSETLALKKRVVTSKIEEASRRLLMLADSGELYSVETGASFRMTLLSHTEPVADALFSLDGKELLTITSRGDFVRRRADGRELNRVTLPVLAPFHRAKLAETRQGSVVQGFVAQEIEKNPEESEAILFSIDEDGKLWTDLAKLVEVEGTAWTDVGYAMDREVPLRLIAFSAPRLLHFELNQMSATYFSDPRQVRPGDGTWNSRILHSHYRQPAGELGHDQLVSKQMKPRLLQATDAGTRPVAIDGFSGVCVSPSSIGDLPPLADSSVEIFFSQKRRRAANFLKEKGRCGSITPQLISTVFEKPRLTTEESFQVLYSLQKPGTFSAKDHLATVLPFLNDPRAIKAHSDLAARLLLNVAMKSDFLFQSLTQRIGKKGAPLPLLAVTGEPLCEPTELKKEITATFERMIRLRLELLGGADEYYLKAAGAEDWTFLLGLAPLVREFPAKQREELRDRLARSLFRSSDPSRPEKLHLLAPNSLRHLLEESLGQSFAAPREAIVEALLDESIPESPHIRIFSGSPSAGSSAKSPSSIIKSERGNGYPIEVLSFPISRQAKGENSFSWTVGGSQYRAKVNLSANPIPVKAVPEAAVNAILTDRKHCTFYSSESNSVVDKTLEEHLKEEPSRALYNRIVSSPESFLESCRDLKRELGAGQCYGVDIAGHSGGGCGVELVFSVNAIQGMDVPSDRKLFTQILDCLRDLLPEHKPLVFTSCGGHGATQQAAMYRLARLVDREVITANGPCASDGFGAACAAGWLSIARLPATELIGNRPEATPARLSIERLSGKN